MSEDRDATQNGVLHGSGEAAQREQSAQQTAVVDGFSRVLVFQRFRSHVEKLQSDVLCGVERELGVLVHDFLTDVEREHLGEIEKNIFAENKEKVDGDLPEKVFVTRRSILSELLDMEHIRTIQHLFIAVLCCIMLNTAVTDLIENERIEMDMNVFWMSFDRFPQVMSFWVQMFCTSCLSYLMFYFWAHNRSSAAADWFDWLWLTIFVSSEFLFVIIPAHLIVRNKFSLVGSIILTCEQTRFLMKMHAFVRSNVPRALCPPDAAGRDRCPGFSRFLYFLFAPTLVYRDHYPRTPAIRWNYVVSNFMQVLGCVVFMMFVVGRFMMPSYQHFNADHVAPSALVQTIFNSLMPGTLTMFLGFFCVLHSWHNAWAEMLLFGDRLFYKDWWNSKSWSRYYRTWNVIVHDWLYTYVYQDLHRCLGARRRPLSLAAVFLLSAVFHEYIISVSLGFFYPVLFCLFVGCGYFLLFLPVKTRATNVFVWFGLMMGFATMMSLYSMEWYARRNCHVVYQNVLLDFVAPRSWMCNSFRTQNDAQNSV